ncbi:cathepsin D-like protein [Anopheles sinensis]|uniref:Cathepsin D-like protein n=1 Tax=Anopheles sinensis TaxID=74873 RepID=A0A084WUS9_ANOSI|nr:cathepsin D-like protein [Anopheles sinensis]
MNCVLERVEVETPSGQTGSGTILKNPTRLDVVFALAAQLLSQNLPKQGLPITRNHYVPNRSLSVEC